MSNRSKAESQSVQPYEGYWTNSEFVITSRLKRKDLTNPDTKPNFVVYLDNGERILVGWTDKQKQRLFFIKEFAPHPTIPNRYTLKVIRMRGEMWRKTIKAVKKGMAKWFEGHDSFGLNAFGQFGLPLIHKVYPSLYAKDIISVQHMAQPTNLLFYMKGKI